MAESGQECPSLGHLVIDMILVHPVRWDLVSEQTSLALPPGFEILAINIGPGLGAVRPLEEVLFGRDFTCYDITSDRGAVFPISSSKHDPIAIVGMAVRAPGASDANEFWKILEQGKSTISKVSQHGTSDVTTYGCSSFQKTVSLFLSHLTRVIKQW